MESKSKNLTEPGARVENGKLIMPMIGQESRVIDIEKLQDLLEWDIKEQCEDLILSTGMLANQLLIDQKDYDLTKIQGCTPKPETLYLLKLISETFKF